MMMNVYYIQLVPAFKVRPNLDKPAEIRICEGGKLWTLLLLRIMHLFHKFKFDGKQILARWKV